MTKHPGPGSKIADFADASLNIEVGAPANEWNE